MEPREDRDFRRVECQNVHAPKQAGELIFVIWKTPGDSPEKKEKNDNNRCKERRQTYICRRSTKTIYQCSFRIIQKDICFRRKIREYLKEIHIRS